MMLLPLALAACGGGPTDQSALAAKTDASARDRAQAARIDNPDAVACVQANASDGEWAVIAGQDAAGEAMLQEVLGRDGTRRCFNDNNVVVYL